MRDIVFYLSIASFAVGVAVSTWYMVPLSWWLWLLVVALGLMLVWRRTQPGLKGRLGLGFLALGLSLFVLGGMRTEWYQREVLTDAYGSAVGETVTFSGVIKREVETRSNSDHIYVTTPDTTILVFGSRHSVVEYGDVVTIVGELTRPEAFTTDLGRSFNYPGYLAARQVEYVVRYPETVVIENSDGGVRVVAYLLAFKTQFMTAYEGVVREPMAGLGEGLLLGVKQALGDELETAFRRTGIIHIVVLSGYNVALVVGFVLFALAFLLPFRARLVVGGIAIVCFALLVGLSATVVRATIMAGFILVAQLIGRTYQVLRGLALAGAVMLLINPYLLVYDVGFQLSFLATFGLIVLVPRLEPYLLWVPTSGLRGIVLATITTQLMVLPLLLYQIGQFSVVSVVVNVLVLPMVPMAMLLSFITGMMALLNTTLATWLALPTEWSLMYIVNVARWFSDLPLAAFSVPAFPFWVVVLLYGSAALWWYKKTTAPVGAAAFDVTAWTIEPEELVRARVLARENVESSSSGQPLHSNSNS